MLTTSYCLLFTANLCQIRFGLIDGRDPATPPLQLIKSEHEYDIKHHLQADARHDRDPSQRLLEASWSILSKELSMYQSFLPVN